MGQRDRKDVASDSDEIVAVFSPMYLVDAYCIAKGDGTAVIARCVYVCCAFHLLQVQLILSFFSFAHGTFVLARQGTRLCCSHYLSQLLEILFNNVPSVATSVFVLTTLPQCKIIFIIS